MTIAAITPRHDYDAALRLTPPLRLPLLIIYAAIISYAVIATISY